MFIRTESSLVRSVGLRHWTLSELLRLLQLGLLIYSLYQIVLEHYQIKRFTSIFTVLMHFLGTTSFEPLKISTPFACLKFPALI